MNYFSALVDGAKKYFGASGTGTTADPFIPYRNSILTDITGNQAIFDPFGNLITVSPKQSVSLRFSGGLQTGILTNSPALTGDGAAAVSNSVLTVSSASSGTASVSSKKVLRYKNGRGLIMKFTAGFSGSGLCYAGAEYAPGGNFNGFVLKYSAGTLSLAYLRNGSEAGAVAVDPALLSALGISIGNLNIYQIAGAYLGVKTPTLFVSKDGVLHKIAEIDFEGSGTSTHVLNPVWRMGVYAANGASVITASWDGSILVGNDDNGIGVPRAFPSALATTSNPSGQISIAAGTQVVLAFFKNTSTTLGEAQLTGFEFIVIPPAAGSGYISAQIIYNPTGLSGTPNYVNNGVMSVCHTPGIGAQTAAPAPITISGGTVVTTVVSDYAKTTPSVGTAINAEDFGLISMPGDEFAILITNSTGGATVQVHFSATWKDVE